MALSREFPRFYRYAHLMEEASEAERNKASRPYDGMAEFSEQHKQMGTQLRVADEQRLPFEVKVRRELTRPAPCGAPSG